jgi:putative nucleotidyltransferase with HDIG domain
MEFGISFFKSKLARRFCLLFFSCACVPIIVLIVLSYVQVVGQLEEQSYLRLKREVNTYGISLFDRMIRIDNELNSVGRLISLSRDEFTALPAEYTEDFEELFLGVGLYVSGEPMRKLYGNLDTDLLGESILRENLEHAKPFVFTSQDPEGFTRFFFGTNMLRKDMAPFTIVAEVKSGYLWGIGANPLLPPMTELSVFDGSGTSIVASQNGPEGSYHELDIEQVDGELRIFQFNHDGQTYYAGVSNLFIKSRFQNTDWTIILSKARRDVMSALDNFKHTYPLIILLFLLLIAYLSVRFIRRGLDPLERLKEGTKRIAQKDFSALVTINSGDEFEELGHSFNEMAAKLDKQFNALQVLGEIDRDILSSLDRMRIISSTLQRLKEFFHCEISALVKLSEESGEHVKVYTMEGRRLEDPKRGFFPITTEERMLFFKPRDFLLIYPGDEGHAFLQRIGGRDDLGYLGLPLSVDGVIRRVLLLGQKSEVIFKEDEISQARQIANQLTVGIANSLTVEKLNNLAKGTIEALARTVDAKSKWTSGHSERVASLSGRMARAMGLAENKVETIVRGGLLHDIGKIAIHRAILDKPDRLTDEEYAEIRNHPEIGEKILEPIKAYHDILPMVLQHHEHYDGSGYPAGLKGEEIDIRARIMAVADVYDALVSNRPYRGGWIAQKAKDLIVKEMGTHFDPEVVGIFLAIFSEDQSVEAMARIEDNFSQNVL